MQDFQKYSIQKQIESLQDRIKWGQDHPYAGYCGDDDAMQDQLECLKREAEELAATREP